MKFFSKCQLVACLIAWLLTAGCASQSGWETQSSPGDFANGTRILAEVVLVTTREQVLANQGLMRGWREKLVSAGYFDSDIVDGSEVTVWSYCYGWNSGVPICAHHGHYVAHVPLEVRDGLQGDSDSEWDTSGDLVEVELTKTQSGHLVGKVVSVYRKFDDWTPCRKTSLQQRSELGSVMSSLAGIGPPRAMWIECDDTESEGWIRRPVRGAPVSAGPPISEWIKLPQ